MATNTKNRKWAYGSNTVISSIVFLAILVFIVLIAERHPWRLDLTESKSFTLSGQTLGVLKEIDKPVQIKAFYSSAAPDQAQGKAKTKDLLDTYAYKSPQIKYEFIDPDTQPDTAQHYEVRTYGTLVLEGYGKTQLVQTADEENITSALLKLSRKDKKKVYFLTGHGEHSIGAQDKEGYSAVRTALEKGYYDVAEFNLLQSRDVPQDASAVVVAGPKKPVTEQERQVLKNYLGRGGRLFVMVDPLTDTGMEEFVSGYGITLGNDVVIDRLSRLFGGSERIPVVVEYGNHKIVEGFNLPTFFPDARSVVPAKEPPKGVSLLPLAMTSQGAWAERDLETLAIGKASLDPKVDMQGPVPLVVLASIARDADQNPGADKKENAQHPQPGILVVAGDSDFAANSYFGLYGNGDLFQNTVNFLAEDLNMISITPRQNTNKPVLLTRNQAQTVFWIVLVFVPLAVLASGLMVYRVRRAQR